MNNNTEIVGRVCWIIAAIAVLGLFVVSQASNRAVAGKRPDRTTFLEEMCAVYAATNDIEIDDCLVTASSQVTFEAWTPKSANAIYLHADPESTGPVNMVSATQFEQYTTYSFVDRVRFLASGFIRPETFDTADVRTVWFPAGLDQDPVELAMIYGDLERMGIAIKPKFEQGEAGQYIGIDADLLNFLAVVAADGASTELGVGISIPRSKMDKGLAEQIEIILANDAYQEIEIVNWGQGLVPISVEAKLAD